MPRGSLFLWFGAEILGHSPSLIYGGLSPLQSAAFYHTSLTTAEQLDKCFWLSPGGKEGHSSVPGSQRASVSAMCPGHRQCSRGCCPHACALGAAGPALLPFWPSTHFLSDPSSLPHHGLGAFWCPFCSPFSFACVFSQSLTRMMMMMIVNIYQDLSHDQELF